MIRVLHLASQCGDFQTDQTASLLQGGLDGDLSIQTRRIGNGAHYRHPISAGWALRRERFDVLHAWDAPGLTAAAIAGNAPILFSPSQFPTRPSLKWLRAVIRYRDVSIVSSSAAQQRAFAPLELPTERCVLIRPGVDGATPAAAQRSSLRTALGFNDDDHVHLCPGESTRAANHVLAIWVVAILHVLDPRHKVLLWGRGTQAESTARLSIRLHQPDLCTLAETKLGRPIEFSELTAAADTVLHTATGSAPTFPLAICMAAGLPIVSVPTSAVSEILEDRRNAIVMPAAAPRPLAQRILELREDQPLQHSIAAQARIDAEELFAPLRYLDQFRAIYFQLGASAASPRHFNDRRTENAVSERRP